ncbi:MAG: restriction endonuclease subunit S [Saprospiraceae bacterium]
MKFGLTENIIEKINIVFEDNSRVDKAIIFGSRAKGNYREGSDIDIAIKGRGLTFSDLLELSVKLDELNLNYKVDLLDYGTIKEKDLIEHIDRIGIEFYSRRKKTEFGEIPTEWELKKIIELKSSAKNAIAMGPFGSNIKAENFVSKGVPVIRGTNLNFNRYVGGEFVFLNDEKADELKGSNCKPGDLVYTHRGTIGQVGIIPEGQYPRYVISQSGMKLTVDENKINSEFLFYFFKSKTGQYQLLKNEAQVGVPCISNPLTTLKEIEVPVPKLSEQAQIVAILSSLDDKIDLLTRQNKTLEQLAETFFRQWFVEEAEKYNPSKLEDWIFFDPKEKMDKQKTYQMFEMKCLSNNNMSIEEGIIREVSSATTFKNGDTLLAKITPCLENGKTGFVMDLAENEIARGSTEFIVMRSKGQVSPYWIYCLARSKDFRDSAIQSMTGTSGRQRVQIDLLKTYRVNVDLKRMQEFHVRSEAYFKKIKTNLDQIHTLIQLRDTLLPKLMNGEVRIN